MRYLPLLLFVGCIYQPQTSVESVLLPSQTVVPVVDTSFCQDAEYNLRNLQCKDAAGNLMWINKLGEHFATTCQRIQDQGGVFLNPKCISTAKTCEEAKTCPPS
jgi:hypothetical protein